MKALVGNPGPDTFKGSDGCSASPDGWWKEACLRHDYEAYLARCIDKKVICLQEELIFSIEHYPNLLHSSRDVPIILVGLKYNLRDWKDIKIDADRDLNTNIARMSPGWKKLPGWGIAKLFFIGVKIGRYKSWRWRGPLDQEDRPQWEQGKGKKRKYPWPSIRWIRKIEKVQRLKED